MTTNEKKVSALSRDDWLRTTFPEWGTWLNESIEAAVVPPKHVRLWWLNNMGIWLKTDSAVNIAIDLWSGTGKQTHDLPDMSDNHQWHRMLGARKIQPNLRLTPQVIDPFAIKQLDALLVTHFHHDHLDKFVAAAILKNCPDDVPFIGPQAVVNQWLAWGVPKARTRVVRPGDVIHIKDCEIDVLESYDRTVLITDAVGLADNGTQQVPDMDLRAVSYLIKTSAGNIYHAGDSHFSVNFAKIGRTQTIDIAILAYAENPIGVQDKMTSVDILRAAEALNCKVVLPMHWDVWSNTLGDPTEIVDLWQRRIQYYAYHFKPYILLPGGAYDWPNQGSERYYRYPRGFEDRFTDQPDMPYPAFL
ncbi:L-ascorbate 6-phosphate lactonase [Lactobacillus sp. CC-MHH1034]|uniref:L-ascorbate 6-phosphate lactonase n=1 Tax=Agrilactobacillus fermenti TaxID=2586909 RepID=UPI001E4180BF|nr:L-ascorbate 6-phosphate lactonase [Agrilactobacillus fermenti]MCD2256356.1 L-ascorbate 6-phosphate lactonase [Agrilactobacillus fermenti]